MTWAMSLALSGRLLLSWGWANHHPSILRLLVCAGLGSQNYSRL